MVIAPQFFFQLPIKFQEHSKNRCSILLQKEDVRVEVVTYRQQLMSEVDDVGSGVHFGLLIF